MQHTHLARRACAALAIFGVAVVFNASPQPAHGAAGANLAPAHGALFGAWTKPRGARTAAQELANSEQQLGRPFDIYHLYYHVKQSLPTRDMVNASASGHTVLMAFDPDPINATPTWQEIWRGDQDAILVKRAQELRGFGAPVMLNFDHEADANIGPNGTAADYVKAYQHVHDLFRAQGANNVIWVWDMRGSLFTSQAAADAMYPGDAYADWVAADAYNWYPGKSGSQWRSFADAFNPFHVWATQRHPAIPQMAEETGVQEDATTTDAGRKPAWIADMAATIKSWPQMKAVLWFNSDQIYPWWYDSSAASLNAFRTVAGDCYFDTRSDACGVGGDTTAPSSPSQLTVADTQPTSFTLSWVPSTDNTAVTGYVVSVNGTQAASTGTTFAHISGVDCSGSCTVTVVALDAAGNASPPATLTVTTPPLGLATNLTAIPAGTQVGIRFTLSGPATVWLDILNAAGTVVTHRLAATNLAAGQQIVYWKRKDDRGALVPGGAYTARLTVQGPSGTGTLAAGFHI